MIPSGLTSLGQVPIVSQPIHFPYMPSISMSPEFTTNSSVSPIIHQFVPDSLSATPSQLTRSCPQSDTIFSSPVNESCQISQPS